jgi:hypothetical protein
MNTALLVVLAGVLIAVWLLAPAWFAFAALGLLLGWTVRGLMRWFRQLRYKWLLLAGASGSAVLVLMVIAISIPSLQKARLPGAAQSHLVHYSAQVQYETAGPAWKICDRIEVHVNPRVFLTQAIESRAAAGGESSDPNPSDLTPDAERRWLVASLQPYGWRWSSSTAEGHVFQRERTAEVQQPWHAIRTKNRVAVLCPERDLPQSFAVYSYGELQLHVPYNVVAATTPDSSRRAAAEPADTEAIVVPFQFSLLAKDAAKPFVQIEVLHPALRNPIVAGTRRLAGLPIVNWLLMGLFGVFQDRLRTCLVRPITTRLGRIRGFRWLQEPPANSSPIAGGSSSEPDAGANPFQKTARPPGILAALYDDRHDRKRRVA